MTQRKKSNLHKPIDDEMIIINEIEGCKWLWARVAIQAIVDLDIKWLMSVKRYIGSFRWICEQIGADWKIVKKGMKKQYEKSKRF